MFPVPTEVKYKIPLWSVDPTATKVPVDPTPTLIVEMPIRSLEIFAT